MSAVFSSGGGSSGCVLEFPSATLPEPPFTLFMRMSTAFKGEHQDMMSWGTFDGKSVEFRLSDVGNLEYGEGHGNNFDCVATSPPLQLADGVPHDVAVTRHADGTVSIYCDRNLVGNGTVRSQIPSGLPQGANSARMWKGQNDLVFKGAIGPVRIYDAALNKDQLELMTANSSPPPTTWCVKLKYNGDVYRIPVQKSTLAFEDVQAVIQETIGVDMENISVKYFDSEKNHCILIPATFTDFLRTARLESDGIFLLQLDLLSHKISSRTDLLGKKMHGREPILEQRHRVDEYCAPECIGLKVEEVEESGCDFEIVDNHSGRCFLRDTVLMTPKKGLMAVDQLKVGDEVVSESGKTLTVAYMKVHAQTASPQRLTTLRTAQTEITVTDDHRVMAPGSQHVEKLARHVNVGDKVRCGTREQRITKVVQAEHRVELVELRFNPDEPVETRMIARHGILTKGAPMPYEIRNRSHLGPFSVELREAETSSLRSRSV